MDDEDEWLERQRFKTAQQEKRLQRRQLKAAQRMDSTRPQHEKVAEMSRLRTAQHVEPTKAHLEKSAARARLRAAQRIEQPPLNAPTLSPRASSSPQNADRRGMVLAAMLLMSPLAYWYSANEEPAVPEPAAVSTSAELETARHRERMEQLDREIATLRAANRKTEQEQQLNGEAQELSNELRSQGIGISPAQARALLQTEKDLMNE